MISIVNKYIQVVSHCITWTCVFLHISTHITYIYIYILSCNKLVSLPSQFVRKESSECGFCKTSSTFPNKGKSPIVILILSFTL